MSNGAPHVSRVNSETWRCPPDASALWLSYPTGRVLAYSNPATSPFTGLGAPPVGALFSDFFPPEIASAIRSALRGDALASYSAPSPASRTDALASYSAPSPASRTDAFPEAASRRTETRGAPGAEAASATFSLESVYDTRNIQRVGRVTVEVVGKEALVLLEADAGATTSNPRFVAIVTAVGSSEAPLRLDGVVRASVVDLLRGAAGERSCPPIAEGDLTQRIAPFRGKLGENSAAVPLPSLLPGATPEPLRTALAAEGMRAYVRIPFTAAGKDYVVHAVAPTVERVGPSVRKALVTQAAAAVAADRAARSLKAAVRESTVGGADVVLEAPPRRHTLPYAPALVPASDEAPRPSGVLRRPAEVSVALLVGDCRNLGPALEDADWVVVRVRDGAAAAAIAHQLRFDLCLIGASLSRKDLDELQIALRTRAAEVPVWHVGLIEEKIPGIPFRSDAEILSFVGRIPSFREAR